MEAEGGSFYMDPFSGLLMMCACMLFGSLAAGYLPLVMAVSPENVKRVTTFGCGLLVGTALVVVLPEGIHVLAACPGHAAHEHAAVAAPDLDTEFANAQELELDHAHDQTDPLAAASEHLHEHDGHAHAGAHDHGHDGGEGEGEEAHDHGQLGAIGLMIVAGFALQLLVDRLSASAGGHGHSHGGGGGGHGHSHGGSGDDSKGHAPEPELPVGVTVITGDEEAQAHHVAAVAAAGGTGGAVTTIVDDVRTQGRARGPTVGAMVGLCIHSAVDGVAVGAASFAGQSSVQMAVFLAIMLHKAPAAFGFTSFLMRAGATRAEILQPLLIFAASAPVSAVLTFAFLGMQVVTYASSTLGYCLLFSAGTFLYVATAHILPDIQASEGPGPLPWRYVLLLFAGMIAPLFLQGEHHH